MSQPPIEQTETLDNERATQLGELLRYFSDRRVCVIATTCSGKSTLQQSIPGTADMDKLLFPMLTVDEDHAVCQPWTPEVGVYMTTLARRYLAIEPGKPIFGTVVLECDLVVQLLVSDDLLAARTAQRGVEFAQAKAMQDHIAEQVETSGLPVVYFSLG